MLVQGDPNQNIPFQMAITMKLFTIFQKILPPLKILGFRDPRYKHEYLDRVQR